MNEKSINDVQVASALDEVKQKDEENRMGTMPINKLLFVMSTPMVISMLVQALYNVVDSMFVAQINQQALTAVSMAFPIQNLMIAFSAGTGVGINALLSRSLGEGNKKDAQAAACNGIFLGILSSIIFMIFGFVGARAFFASQTSDEQIIGYGVEYVSVICIGSIGIFLQITLERIMQSTGKTVFNMITQTTGAVFNIIFDPILIFGLFGFPKMGVTGAALATVGGQILGMLLSFVFNARYNEEVHVTLKGFRPSSHIIKQIYSVGLPSIIMQSISSVMVYLLNQILMSFEETAVTVFGVYYKLQSFVFMPVFGLNNGMIPIVAYNYGASKKDRIMKTMRLAVIAASTMMVIGVAIFMVFPEKLLGIFKASENMLSLGVPALRIISLSFILAGYNIVVGSMFQALGNGVYSLIVSVMRQIVVIVPVAFVLSRFCGATGVWLSYPIAEIVAVATNIILFTKTKKMKIDRLVTRAV